MAVGNDGDAELEVSLAVLGDAWLELAPRELVIEVGEEAQVVFTADCNDTGEFNTEIAVVTNDPDVAETSLAVVLTCHALDSASLTVSVEGLPAELDADILVAGPDGFETNLSDSDDLVGLAPGEYTVTASPVGDYLPTEASQQIDLEAGDEEVLTVTYELDADLPPGSLSIAADNLPDGLDFSAVVESTDLGYEETFIGAQTIDDLAPGDYTVTFDDVEDGDIIYRAQPVDVEVLSEQTAEATADYELLAALPGSLEVTVDFPANVVFDLQLHDGDQVVTTETVNGGDTVTFDDLEPRAHTLTIESAILDQWGNEFLTDDLTGFDESIDVISDDTVTSDLSGLTPSVVRLETWTTTASSIWFTSPS